MSFSWFVASVSYHGRKRRFPRIFARAARSEENIECIEKIEEGNDADAASTKHAGAAGVTHVYLQYMHSILPIHNYHHGVPNTVSKK